MRFKIVLLIPFLLFADTNKSEVFKEKYLSNCKIANDVSVEKLHRKADINISRFNELMDSNNSKVKGFQKGVVFNEDRGAKEIAKDIKSLTDSDKFKKNVKSAEDYILYDKDMNYSKYLGKFQNYVKDFKKGSVNNQFLNRDEKLYIVISSSIPKETIRSYIKDVQNVATDVTFVMRGTIGGIHKIQPTLKWLNSLLVKDPKKPKDRYKANIEINPKITRRYGITKVPALIYIKNYNPISEMNKPFTKEGIDKEDVYIAYGDGSIEYTLKKINKQVKSKGIERFLKEMKKGFFN